MSKNVNLYSFHNSKFWFLKKCLNLTVIFLGKENDKNKSKAIFLNLQQYSFLTSIDFKMCQFSHNWWHKPILNAFKTQGFEGWCKDMETFCEVIRIAFLCNDFCFVFFFWYSLNKMIELMFDKKIYFPTCKQWNKININFYNAISMKKHLSSCPWEFHRNNVILIWFLCLSIWGVI